MHPVYNEEGLKIIEDVLWITPQTSDHIFKPTIIGSFVIGLDNQPEEGTASHPPISPVGYDRSLIQVEYISNPTTLLCFSIQSKDFPSIIYSLHP